MRKLVLFTLLLSLLSANLYAQRVITGKVTDEKGGPLANVSVTVKDFSVGTSTNDDGNYSISVPANGKILIFTAVNKVLKEVSLGNSAVVNTTLSEKTDDLEDVVVVSYGTVKKSQFVGTAVTVGAEQFAKRPLSNALNALVGAGPGIQTTAPSGAPGSGPGIVMRGIASYSLSSGPLYVVDGAIYDGGFSNINPDDIETITALKDATTTALYGSRGANGVILITTKRGKAGKQTLSAKTQYALINPALAPYSTVNASDFYELSWESLRNGLHYGSSNIPMADASALASGTWARFTTGANAGLQNYNGTAYSDIYQHLGSYNPFNVGNREIVGIDGKINPNAVLRYADDLDWIKQASRTAKRTEHSINFTSGTDKSDFLASFNYLNEQGYSLRSDMKRFTARVNANTKITNWLKTGVNLSGNRSYFNNAATGGIVNPFYFGRYIAPIYPVHLHDPSTGAIVLDALGNPQYDFGNFKADYGYDRPYNNGRHTIAEHLWNRDLNYRDVVSTRAYAELTFTPWLKLTTNISYDITNTESESYENTLVGDGAPSGRLGKGTGRTESYTFNQLLNFNKKFGRHQIDALLGHENYSYRSSGTSGMRIGQSFENIYQYGNFVTINSLTSSLAEAGTEGYFSRFQYSLDDKYNISLSGRRDGNSRFHKDVRWSNFWSVGGSWSIDREEFFNIPLISQLRLKASYGEVGNANGIGTYPYQAQYGLAPNASYSGVVMSSLASPTLTWEVQSPLEIGLDFGLLNNRISGSVLYYSRETKELIFSVPQPLQNGGTTGGAYSVQQNIGNMTNRGFEVQLNGQIVRAKDVNWDMTINASTNKNRITKMPETTPILTSSPFRREAGRSVYDFFTRTFYGVDPADGQVLYLGLNAAYDPTNTNIRLFDNGKGGFDTTTIDHNLANQTYIGKSSLPKVFGSIINNVRYKNFDLSVTLTYQLGGYVYDGVYASLMSTATSGGTTFHSDVKNRWQAPGDVTDVPRLDNTRSAQYGAASTRWLIDATHLGINNVSLSYTLPRSLVTKINANNARIFVSGENLHYFSKRKGMNVNGSMAGTTGDGYNVARTINFGLNLNF